MGLVRKIQGFDESDSNQRQSIREQWAESVSQKKTRILRQGTEVRAATGIEAVRRVLGKWCLGGTHGACVPAS